MAIKGILAFGLVLSMIIFPIGCNRTPYFPSPPTIPPDVVVAWKTLPPPNGMHPSVSKALALPRYAAPVITAYPDLGYFTVGQWIDIVIKSHGVPAHFGSDRAGTVGVMIERDEGGFGPPPYGSFSGIPAFAEAGGAPTVGKYLLPEVQWTETDTGVVYTTAFRFYIPISTTWNLAITNYDPAKEVNITYEVYPLSIRTPGWADYAYEQALNNYLDSFPEDKQYEAIAKWMAQCR